MTKPSTPFPPTSHYAESLVLVMGVGESRGYVATRPVAEQFTGRPVLSAREPYRCRILLALAYFDCSEDRSARKSILYGHVSRSLVSFALTGLSRIYSRFSTPDSIERIR